MQQATLFTSPSPRWGLGRFIKAAAALGVVFVGALSATGSGCGKFCDGGFVRMVPGNDQGICEGKCDPTKCLAGNVCVDNHCVLECASHEDCDTFSQECVPARADDSSKSVSICLNTGKAPIGTKCPFGTECMGLNACPDGSSCDYTQCGGGACTLDTAACGDLPNCKQGLCPDKTPCTVPGCTMDQCRPLVCHGTGQGDADAYCTMDDCASDTDCTGGFWCATAHDPHAVCGVTPQKGNNNFCGKTSEACIDPNASGGKFTEGQYCLLHKSCRERTECSPCTGDLDCSLVMGQHCIQVGGEQVCAKGCSVDTDCDSSYECMSGSCVPRSGKCTGTGNYCDPCRSDADCGDKNSKLACVSLTGEERGCVDISFSTDCTTDADCPTGPDGVHGTCLDENYGEQAGDTAYHKCYAQINLATNKTSCWCSKKGGECFLAKECCSNKCTGANPNNGIVGHCG